MQYLLNLFIYWCCTHTTTAIVLGMIVVVVGYAIIFTIAIRDLREWQEYFRNQEDYEDNER